MWEDIKNSWKSGGMLYRLIWVNVVVFLILNGALLITKLGGIELSVGVRDGFGLATTNNLSALASRPWSVITHMFTHTSILHLFFNMILLWWMGRMYQAEVGSRRLLSTYLLGGFAGFLLYLVAYNVLPGLQTELQGSGVGYALGSSAAVMAIFTATATLSPKRKINFILFGTVELKYIALAYVLFDYFGVSQGVNAGGKIAHLGGAFFGYFMILLSKKGYEVARPLEKVLDYLMSIIPSKHGGNRNWTVFKNKSKRRSKSASRSPKSDEDFNLEKRNNEARLDVILDKIARHGYDDLTKDDKQFLFNQSKKN